ncbi:MAG: metallopeptidase TldD-related protein [Candidatus Lightella neohaematopini]|nr:metallopeptidase TldD-related protein [Candidatus Lightella neohaematopini]
MIDLLEIKEKIYYAKKIINELLTLVSSYSATAAINFITTIGSTFSTYNNKIEYIKSHNHSNITIDIFFKNRKSSTSSSNTKLKELIKIVHNLIVVTKYLSPDNAHYLADLRQLAINKIPNLSLFNPHKLTSNKCIDLINLVEQSAKKYSKLINSTYGYFNYCYNTRTFGNSYGMLQNYTYSCYQMHCQVIAKNNNSMERDYYYTINSDFNKLEPYTIVGEKAAYRAIQRLNSNIIKTKRYPVIFLSEVATELFYYLAKAINGYNVYKKSTFLIKKFRKIIFPSWLNIIERPNIPYELGSTPFDHEGVKTNDIFIIKNGVLNTWLLDSYSSRKLNLNNNGHAGGIYNWYVTNNNINFSDLLKLMHNGILVTELMGHEVNINNGNYSKGAFGFLIKNGCISYPISGITIASNLSDMFSNISSISNDIELRSNIKCGSLLINNMNVAGL